MKIKMVSVMVMSSLLGLLLIACGDVIPTKIYKLNTRTSTLKKDAGIQKNGNRYIAKYSNKKIVYYSNNNNNTIYAIKFNYGNGENEATDKQLLKDYKSVTSNDLKKLFDDHYYSKKMGKYYKSSESIDDSLLYDGYYRYGKIEPTRRNIETDVMSNLSKEAKYNCSLSMKFKSQGSNLKIYSIDGFRTYMYSDNYFLDIVDALKKTDLSKYKTISIESEFYYYKFDTNTIKNLPTTAKSVKAMGYMNGNDTDWDSYFDEYLPSIAIEAKTK